MLILNLIYLHRVRIRFKILIKVREKGEEGRRNENGKGKMQIRVFVSRRTSLNISDASRSLRWPMLLASASFSLIIRQAS